MSQSDHQHDERTRQPNSRHCFVCGLESPVGLRVSFEDNGRDEVRARYTAHEAYQGYPGVVHGGVVAALLDETAGRTPMISNPNRFMFTGKLSIRYRQPVPTDTELTLIGRLLKDRGRIVQAHSELRLPDGTVAAEADVTLVEMPGSGALSDSDLERLGWRVYSDEELAAAHD
ncbi:MAG TPA: PaaI family thioesterase [Aggregatilineales bacterium]|nr:PaaI family thioesterase [Aggregatilineales bacterium]